jgi:hypothetical protein
MSDGNQISTVEQFRRAAQADRERRGELVTLPSGLTAVLVRPTPAELFLRTGLLPQSVAAHLAGEDAGATMDGEQVVRIARQTLDLCRFVFVAPRVPDELQPGIDIPVADVEWALRWARGEVASNGCNLAQFRRDSSGPAIAAGESG